MGVTAWLLVCSSSRRRRRWSCGRAARSLSGLWSTGGIQAQLTEPSFSARPPSRPSSPLCPPVQRVGDPYCTEVLRQGVAVALGMVPGARHRADVDQTLDLIPEHESHQAL